MKKPREILLERHREAIPRLDRLRREVLDREVWARTPVRGSLWGWLAAAWGELIWPSRRAWAGLAVIWIVVFTVNHSLDARSPTADVRAAGLPPQTVLAFWRQERLLGGLVEAGPPGGAAPARTMVPQPRSQRREEFLRA